MTSTRLLVAALVLALPVSGHAQTATVPAPARAYADLADLAVAAPIVLDARIRSTARIEDAIGVAAGRQRFYVEADVLGLVRGPGGFPARVAYVTDVPLDARGKLPKLKKRRVLLLARPVAGKPAQIQLVSPGAQVDWSAPIEADLRAILAELVSPDAAPRVTGVRSAFNQPGTVPGESETQIFLTTAREDPVSISVIRRPGEAPRWAVALGEIVDEAAGPPRERSLLWYRLACGLPARLPAAALEGQEGERAEAARADYRVVVDGLGPCGRTFVRDR